MTQNHVLAGTRAASVASCQQTEPPSSHVCVALTACWLATQAQAQQYQQELYTPQGAVPQGEPVGSPRESLEGGSNPSGLQEGTHSPDPKRGGGPLPEDEDGKRQKRWAEAVGAQVNI